MGASGTFRTARCSGLWSRAPCGSQRWRARPGAVRIWVHLGKPRETLAEWLAPVASSLARYDLDEHALVEEATFELPCNWKAAADQFNEAYHVRTTHPYLLGSVDDTSIQVEAHGPHFQQVFRIGGPSPRIRSTEVTESLAELLRAAGADPASLDGDARRAPEAIRKALRARGVSRLTDDELVMGRSWYVFPSLTFNAYAHGLQMHRYRPHPRDPERMWLDQITFQRSSRDAARRVPLVQSYVRPGEGSGGRVVEDDIAHLVEVQRGMRSPGFEVLRLGGHERCSLHMHATIDHYLASA